MTACGGSRRSSRTAIWGQKRTARVRKHEPDGSGKYRATYTTFHRTGDGRFRFDGYCFKGENQNRVEKTYSQQRFEKRLAEAREEAERDG